MSNACKQDKLNSNMGCIETPADLGLGVAFGTLNSNMGCIETELMLIFRWNCLR